MTLTPVPDKATGDILLESDWDTYIRDNINGLIDLVAVRNMLVNPDFEVLQRGNGPFSANGAYTADRWQLLLGASSTAAITGETTTIDTLSRGSLKWVYTHSANSSLDQKLEGGTALRGQAVTFTVRVRQGVANSARAYINDSGAKTYSTTSATVGSFVTFSVTASISGTASSVSVGVELSASDTVYTDNAVCAIGSSAPQFLPPNPAENLARCQRYYEIIGEAVSSLMYQGVLDANGYYRMSVTFKVKKATNATITKNGTWSLSGWAGFASSNTGVDSSYWLASGGAGVNGYTWNNTSGASITAEANP